jgi:hypothetical protein
MQALYITLVAAAYQQFMQKWQKFIRHRRLWFVRHKVQHQQIQPLLTVAPESQVDNEAPTLRTPPHAKLAGDQGQKQEDEHEERIQEEEEEEESFVDLI